MNGPTSLVVLAKSPVPGRSKTRLCPRCSPSEAATLAEAALADTLAAVLATPVERRVLVLDGAVGSWLPGGIEVLPQRGDGLDERLAAAFDDVGGPALLIGMDTPQVTPALLGEALETLRAPGQDAVLGVAEDGGYWAIGLRGADPRAFLGIPMSRSWTARSQLARLADLGMRCAPLASLRDVDCFADALAVAELAPGSRFARALRGLSASAA